jgi:hypothetical protein
MLSRCCFRRNNTSEIPSSLSLNCFLIPSASSKHAIASSTFLCFRCIFPRDIDRVYCGDIAIEHAGSAIRRRRRRRRRHNVPAIDDDIVVAIAFAIDNIIAASRISQSRSPLTIDDDAAFRRRPTTSDIRAPALVGIILLCARTVVPEFCKEFRWACRKLQETFLRKNR